MWTNITNNTGLFVTLAVISSFLLVLLGLLAWQFNWFGKLGWLISHAFGATVTGIKTAARWTWNKMPTRPKFRRLGWFRFLRKPAWLSWANAKSAFVWIWNFLKRQGGKIMRIRSWPAWLKPSKVITGGSVIVVIMILFNIAIFATLTKLETGTWFKPHPVFSSAALLAILGYLYTIDAIARGFRPELQVAEDRLALRLFYGVPLDTVSSGPPVLPRGLLQIRIESRMVQQRQFPAEDDKIFRGEMKPDPENPDRPIIPDGMKPPIRIPFGTSITNIEAKRLFGHKTPNDFYTVTTPDGREVDFNPDVPTDGLSKKRVTAEAVLFVRYRIRSDGMRFFVQNIGSFPEADRQIEDTIVSVISRFYTRISVAQALHNFDWMNAVMYKRLAEKTGLVPGQSAPWGLDLEDVSMKLISLNHDLNQSIADAARADFVAQKLVLESQGEKVQLTNRGEGDANALRMKTREELKGRASGAKAIAKDLNLEPSEVYGGLVASEITKGPNTTFVPGIPGLIDLGRAAKALFSGNKPNNT